MGEEGEARSCDFKHGPRAAGLAAGQHPITRGVSEAGPGGSERTDGNGLANAILESVGGQ